MLDKIAAIIRPYMPDPSQEIQLQHSLLGDLGLKSMDLINAVTDLEDTFGITIPDQDLRIFRCVADVIEYLDSRDIQ